MKKTLTVFAIYMLFFTAYAYCAPVPNIPNTQQPIIKNTEQINAPVYQHLEKKSEEQKQQLPQVNTKQLTTNDIREQAKFLYNSNDIKTSLALYNKIPEQEKLSEDWFIISNIAQDNNRTDDAIFYLKKAIETDNKNYKAHYNLGNLYFNAEKYNMALDEYRKALKIKKDFAYAYYNKGCCYLKKKSYFNARYEFKLAIKENPNEPSFYYNLAYTYKMLKKPKKAQEAIEIYNQLITR